MTIGVAVVYRKIGEVLPRRSKLLVEPCGVGAEDAAQSGMEQGCGKVEIVAESSLFSVASFAR